MTTVYISGPMTGYEDYNRPAFNEMQAQLEAAGYEVLNPASVEIEDGSWSDYMRADLPLLARADLVVVLRGWINSKGARLEVAIANQLRIPIHCFIDKEEMPELALHTDLHIRWARIEAVEGA